MPCRGKISLLNLFHCSTPCLSREATRLHQRDQMQHYKQRHEERRGKHQRHMRHRCRRVRCENAVGKDAPPKSSGCERKSKIENSEQIPCDESLAGGKAEVTREAEDNPGRANPNCHVAKSG